MTMSHYATPLRVEKTIFSTVYTMPERNLASRPGRTLNVALDMALPYVEGFQLNYIYWVTLLHKGAFAGNHYHHKKTEIFCPVDGDMTVVLKHPDTQVTESLTLSAAAHTRLLVPTGISHKVICHSERAILLVLANSASADGDEVPCVIEA